MVKGKMDRDCMYIPVTLQLAFRLSESFIISQLIGQIAARGSLRSGRASARVCDNAAGNVNSNVFSAAVLVNYLPAKSLYRARR